MKIGILTFHSQINYGGVLQCFALQEVLRLMGYEAVVIDRWFSTDHEELYPQKDNSPIIILKHMVRDMLFCGDSARYRRYVKTQRFINRYLKLTPYSFCQWKEAPRQLGVDMLVVGSDQVWNATWQDPGVFLLESAPSIPAISYAASYGMREIPADMQERYREGYKRFSAISVREVEGKELVKALGAEATVVVDPSQLLSAKQWLQALQIKQRRTTQVQHIVCYFISESVDSSLPVLEAYAKANGCKVDIVVQFFNRCALPKSLNEFFRRLKSCVSSVQVRLSADPRDFIGLFANSDVVISDSFHALMFASIFHKNVRILRPRNELRANMFGRITDFAAAYVDGDIVAEDLSSALSSLKRGVSYREDLLLVEREKSVEWLNRTIKKNIDYEYTLKDI